MPWVWGVKDNMGRTLNRRVWVEPDPREEAAKVFQWYWKYKKMSPEVREGFWYSPRDTGYPQYLRAPELHKKFRQ